MVKLNIQCIVKLIITYYYMTSDNAFSDWLMSLVTFFDKTL